MTKLFVLAARSRPDFRLVLAFVWGDDTDTDTDGNSHPVSSREWTELHAQNRDRPEEVFNVFPVSVEPLVLQVQSEQEWLAVAVAHLLAELTEGGASDRAIGPFVPAESVLSRVGTFDVPAAWARFRNSPFQRATIDDPYPALRRSQGGIRIVDTLLHTVS